MNNVSWLKTIRLCLAMLCIAAFSGTGSVAAYQRGDVSTPEAGADGGWAALGEAVITQEETTASATIDGDVYVLPSSGAEVIIGSGVTAEDPAESEFPDQIIVSTPGGLGAIAVFQDLRSPIDVMHVYVDTFGESMDSMDEVDVQSDRFFASGLYQIVTDGSQFYFFISVDAATSPGNLILQVVIAEGDDLADSIVLLRENVVINGDPMFATIDEDEIQDIAVRHEES